MASENSVPSQAVTQPSETCEYIFRAGADMSALEVAQLRADLGATVVETSQCWGFELWQLDQPLDGEAAEIDGLGYLSANLTLTAAEIQAEFSSDPEADRLWGQHNTGQSGGLADADIDVPEAWAMSRGAGVTVAVIDTGVDYTHPDLAANMWVNTGEIAGNGIDDDGNGYVDDIYGYDFAENDGDPMDEHSHGTHVAGTIAAVSGNGIGVAGVAPEAQIMALRFIDDSGSGSLFDAIQALEYAVMMGAEISNNSWGGGGFSMSLANAIALAGEAGHTFVTSAGNSGLNIADSPHYPASFDASNLISVGASNDLDMLAYFSNYSFTDVDVIAPGQSIYSTELDGGYGYKSGTSMAAPHVAGVAALLLAQEPDLTPEELRQRLIDTSDPISALASRSVSGGRVNAAAALEAGTTLTVSGHIREIDGAGLAGWRVFLDADGDGRRDRDEAVTFTDAEGRYAFSGLEHGTYRIVADIAAGYTVAGPDQDGSDIAVSEVGDPGYRLASAFAWRDISATGTVLSLGDEGRRRVDLPFALPWFGEEVSRLSITANGAVHFGAAAPGNRALGMERAPVATLLPFWADLSSEHGGTIRVLADAEAGEVTVHFDGLRSYDGRNAYDFQLVLTAAGDISLRYQNMSDLPEDVAIGLVGPDGTARLSLDPAQVVAAGGVRLTPAPDTKVVVELDTSSGVQAADIIVQDEGEASGSLSGQLWLDTDGDGLWDWGESALAGHSVYLDANDNGLRDAGEAQTVTDASGAYVFDALSAGRHVVRHEVPAGWTASANGTFGYQLDSTASSGLPGTAIDWQTPSGTVTALTGLGDDGAITLDLPFLFPFFGAGYGQVTVSANGYLTFTGDGEAHDNQDLESDTLPGPMIAVFWDDLSAAEATVSSRFVAGAEQVVISWQGMGRYEGTGQYDFQVVLHGSGQIEMIYGAMTGPLDSASIGISDGTGLGGIGLLHNAVGLSADMGFRFVPVAAPDSGAEAIVAEGAETGAVNLGSRPESPEVPVLTDPVSSLMDQFAGHAQPWQEAADLL